MNGKYVIAIAMLLINNQTGLAADLAKSQSVTPPAPVAEVNGIWAAIAFSETDARHGFFWGADKREAAETIALRHCQHAGGKSCVIVTSFRNHRDTQDEDDTGFPYNSCGALAVDEQAEGPMSWGALSAPTRMEAEKLSLQACAVSGDDCRIREWVCT